MFHFDGVDLCPVAHLLGYFGLSESTAPCHDLVADMGITECDNLCGTRAVGYIRVRADGRLCVCLTPACIVPAILSRATNRDAVTTFHPSRLAVCSGSSKPRRSVPPHPTRHICHNQLVVYAKSARYELTEPS